MEAKKDCIHYVVYSNASELKEIDRQLMDHARDAVSHAYAPYSSFKVGAAFRTSTGEIITGSNQENSSFPIGQCAERVALYQLIHQFGRQALETIAIIADHKDQILPASPCGSCRQLLLEYRNGQELPIRLLLGSTRTNEIFEIHDVRDLLPLAFSGEFLGG